LATGRSKKKSFAIRGRWAVYPALAQPLVKKDSSRYKDSPVTDSRLARQTAERLIGSRAQLLKCPCLVGLDGFVEQTYRVVQERQTATKFVPYQRLDQLLSRLSEKEKGFNLEIVREATKMAGDAPVTAFALSTLGAPVHYVGMCGEVSLHPVFSELAKRATVHPLLDPVSVHVLEFEEGRIALGEYASLYELSWELLKKKLGEALFKKLWNDSHLVAFLNWSQVPNLSGIWKRILSDVIPRSEARKFVLVDLGDPSSRPEADLLAALKILEEFQEKDDVLFLLNEPEALQVAKVLRLKKPGATPQGMSSLASSIREKLGLHTVVIHPARFCVGADAQGDAIVEGPYTPKPKVLAGAGAHFTAGFATARLLGLGLPHSLELAAACSGFYVRHGVSPNREQLVRFLQTL
jgi:sugar/nucleoside kinase (ribokinase family)